MSEAHLGVKPCQVTRRIAPVQTNGGPTRRLGVEWGKRLAMAGGLPSHVEHGVARRRLIARVLQKGEEFLARDVVLAQREGLDRHEVLRSLILEPPALVRRTAHDETPGRKSDHDGAFGTFLKLAILSLLGNARGLGKQQHRQERQRQESLGQSNHALPNFSGVHHRMAASPRPMRHSSFTPGVERRCELPSSCAILGCSQGRNDMRSHIGLLIRMWILIAPFIGVFLLNSFACDRR
jgi:hypothetical protein